MRILLTVDPEIPVPPITYGGIERIADMLVRALMTAGHEVALVAREGSTCPASRLFVWPGKSSQSTFDTLRNTLCLARAVRTVRPDVIHSFSRLAYLLPHLRGKPPVVMSYQREPSPRTVGLANRLAAPGILTFTGCSEYIAGRGRRAGGRWQAIPNFVDTSRLTFQATVAHDAPLVFLSRVESIKGADLAIEIARRSGVRLVIAGNHAESGPEAEYWRHKIEPEIGHDGIEYVGPVDDAQKDELLGRARAMLVPIQWNEPFGIVFVGALLGGALIDAPYAIADGRHCLEHMLLRFWGFLDGSTQEMLDHYYLSITFSAQKMFADFAPSPIDRLMGRILVDRTTEMLITVYHPALRRFVAASGRARLPGVLVEQDGIYGALHTVSKAGVLKYLDKPASTLAHGMPVWGGDFPPGRVALQSLPSAWAPRWASGLIDDKPVPFEETSTETTRGYFKPPLWRRTYLGRWYGLASTDIRGGTFDLVGQWVRQARPSTVLEDLGTLTARYSVNTADLAATSGGVTTHGGLTLTYQSRNRAIVFAKPHTNRSRFMAAAGEGGVARLATVIGLWNFMASPDWKIFVDGEKIETFPHRLSAGQRILIHDGVSYLGIIPLPATDLGRDTEVEIGVGGGGGQTEPNKAVVTPALTISIFNLKRDKPLAVADLDLERIRSRSFGGFVLEMGDAAEYASFEAFAKHMRSNKLVAEWDEGRRQLEVSYRRGTDLMEAAFTTDFSQQTEVHFAVSPGVQERAIPYRRLNGQWPYLPPGLERDTTWSQQGTTGRLEKNGAVLVTEPGRKAYLLADPLSGAIVGYNPLPDAQAWALTTRDGVALRPDGKVGLLRVEYRPWLAECDVDYAPKPDQQGTDMARNLTFTGLSKPPKVRLNGKPVEATPISSVGGFQIPLV
jgi:glycosyltransferase involved in cell wall biosynthesis